MLLIHILRMSYIPCLMLKEYPMLNALGCLLSSAETTSRSVSAISAWDALSWDSST